MNKCEINTTYTSFNRERFLQKYASLLLALDKEPENDEKILALLIEKYRGNVSFGMTRELMKCFAEVLQIPLSKFVYSFKKLESKGLLVKHGKTLYQIHESCSLDFPFNGEDSNFVVNFKLNYREKAAIL